MFFAKLSKTPTMTPPFDTILFILHYQKILSFFA